MLCCNCWHSVSTLSLLQRRLPFCCQGSLKAPTSDMRMLACFLQVAYQNEGLEAIVFTADGDMRQALNNLQVGSLSCVGTPMAVRLMLSSRQ